MLDEAHKYHECLTETFAAALVETCIWAFKHHGHAKGVGLRVEYKGESRALPVRWERDPGPNADKCYTDHDQVADDAACILALESIRLLTGKTGVERSAKGTRFDYYLSTSEDDTLIFNDASFLEVSGIFGEKKGNTVQSRRNRKINRLEKPGGPGLSEQTYICIVELSTPWADVVLS